MVTWVIYDISEDKTRNKIAKLCQQAGLYRVQKSVFLGELGKNRADELVQQFAELIDPLTDRIYFSPLCSDDYRKVRILGCDFDHPLVGNTCSQFIF